MSTMRKTLKILSFILVIAGIGLICYGAVSLFSGIGTAALLMAGCQVVAGALDVVLGCKGVGAANVPARAEKLRALIVASVVVAVAACIPVVMYDGLWVIMVLNAVIVLAYAVVAHKVYQESLR